MAFFELLPAAAWAEVISPNLYLSQMPNLSELDRLREPSLLPDGRHIPRGAAGFDRAQMRHSIRPRVSGPWRHRHGPEEDFGTAGPLRSQSDRCYTPF